VNVVRCLPPPTSSLHAADANAGGVGVEYTLGQGKGENWGEKYATPHLLDLYFVHLAGRKIAPIPNVPGGYTGGDSSSSSSSGEGGYVLGQPSLSPCGRRIVYTGWDAWGGGDGVTRADFETSTPTSSPTATTTSTTTPRNYSICAIPKDSTPTVVL